MKIRERKNKKQLVLAREVLGSPESNERPLRELLDFVEREDENLLDNICGNNSVYRAQPKLLALASLRLLYPEHGRTSKVAEGRRGVLEPWEGIFSEILQSGDPTDFRRLEAAGVYVFPALENRTSVPNPTSDSWNRLSEVIMKQANSSVEDKIEWLSVLPALDYVAFKQLDYDRLKKIIEKQIAEIRLKHTLIENPGQTHLLIALAQARLIFPSEYGSESTTEAELEAMKKGLKTARAKEAKQEQGSFPFAFFYLTILLAPEVVVDREGIHLPSPKKLSVSVPLPIRPNE